MNRYLSLLILFGASLSGFAQTCTTFPCVVASVSVTDQTAPVGPIALVTPATGGLFRVMGYMESSAVLGSDWGLQFKYTDDLATRSPGVVQFRPAQSSGFTYAFRDVAGQPITYTVSQIKTSSGGNYDLFIVVEQLQ